MFFKCQECVFDLIKSWYNQKISKNGQKSSRPGGVPLKKKQLKAD